MNAEKTEKQAETGVIFLQVVNLRVCLDPLPKSV